MLTEGYTQVAPARVRWAHETRSELGRNPGKKAVVLSLPSIESSFVSYYARGLTGFSESDYPALRIAAEVLNATEGYLWVRVVYDEDIGY